MHPTLAERVERSVTGRRPGVKKARTTALLRVALIAILVLAAISFIRAQRRERAETAQARAALLGSVREASGRLTDSDRAIEARSDLWLTGFARSFDEIVSPEAREDLAGLLRHPLLYVRGPAASFATSKDIAVAAEASAKDPFVTCLVAPPVGRDETAMAPIARAARAGTIEPRTANVRRLREVYTALPFLMPAWAVRIEGALDLRGLSAMKKDFEHAPIEAGIAAAKSDYVLVVMDEAGDGPMELDGERPRWVRIGMGQLSTGKIFFRVRKRVDPGWISPPRRAELASGLDGCRLALDLRAELTAAR